MDLIPKPGHVTDYGPHFCELGPRTKLAAGEGTARTERWLRGALGAATGLPLAPGDGADDDVIGLSIHPMVTKDLGEEGYRLTVTPKGVHLVGGAPRGSSGVPRHCGSCSARTRTGERRFPAGSGDSR